MRRVVSIFFVAIFLFNIIGHYPVFVIRQSIIQHGLNDMLQTSLTSGSLVLLTFTPQEIKSLKWLKENEFRYKDEMYDIVLKKKGENGKINFYCFQDSKEKKLIADFEKHIQNNMENASDNQKKENNFNKNLLKDYCPSELLGSLMITGIGIGYNRFIFELNSFDPEGQSPPPKLS